MSLSIFTIAFTLVSAVASHAVSVYLNESFVVVSR